MVKSEDTTILKLSGGCGVTRYDRGRPEEQTL